MKNLTYVGGSKGGTGKSLICMALVDYVRRVSPKEEILLIETDSSNPDVGRLYENTDGVSIRGVLLDEEEKGWVTMADYIDDTSARHIVINSMAASNLGIRVQGPLFEQSMIDSGLEINFNVFWACNRYQNICINMYYNWLFRYLRAQCKKDRKHKGLFKIHYFKARL
jgi:hypothetical protein